MLFLRLFPKTLSFLIVAKIGKGTIIMNRAVIHQDVDIGNNCIINTGAIIEHDVKLVIILTFQLEQLLTVA